MQKLPRGYLSYNQIRTYQTCPLKYYLSYIEEVTVPVNEKIILGSAFHESLEFYLREKIDGTIIPEKSLVTSFKTAFNRLVNSNEVDWGEPKSHILKKGIAFIQYFCQEVAEKLDPLMVEKDLSYTIPELGIELKGILDLIEKDFSISDFKTSNAKWSKNRVAYSKLQIIIYKYLFENCFSSNASQLYFKVFYAKNEKNIKYQDLKVKFSDLDYENMIKVVKYISESIRAGHFYKNESYTCRFCDFKHICRNYGADGKKNENPDT